MIPCNTKNYGIFPVRQTSQAWVEYANSQFLQRTFRNSDSLDQTFVYSFLQSSIQSGVAINCLENGRCGLCCDQFSQGYFYTALSDGGNRNFTVNVVKDFSDNAITDSADLVPDMVEISFGAEAPVAIRPGITNPAHASLKLYGRTFTNVYQWGTPADPKTPVPGLVSAFYFTQKEGVVGYVTGTGLVYCLVRK